MMSSPGDPAAAPVAGAGNTGSSENGSFSPHNLFSVIRRCQEIRIIFLSQGSDFSRNKNIEGLAITQIFLLLGRDCNTHMYPIASAVSSSSCTQTP